MFQWLRSRVSDMSRLTAAIVTVASCWWGIGAQSDAAAGRVPHRPRRRDDLPMRQHPHGAYAIRDSEGLGCKLKPPAYARSAF